MLWRTLNGGVSGSKLISGTAQAAEVDRHAFSFVQISDSHIGFSKDPNLDPASTLTEAVDKICAAGAWFSSGMAESSVCSSMHPDTSNLTRCRRSR